MPVEPTPRRRRLGTEIRRAREALGWSQEEAAQQLGYKALSTISKIENGTQGVKLQVLPHFFEVLQIHEEARRSQWRELVRRAAEPDWHQRYQGVVDDPLSDYLTEIEEAVDLFHWDSGVLHGLLQIPEYERAIIEGSRAWTTADDIERFIAMRAEHRRVMAERQPPLKIWAVIPEGLLRQEVGGRPAAKAQVEHLIDLLRGDPNTTIQILPLSAGAHAGMDGPFMLMSFATGSDTVTIEATRARLHLTDSESVEVYRTTSNHLKSDALGQKASLSLLKTIAKELAS
ncbi:transcriptional regulator with XRE-family HTH domain [Kitasatospora sp. MAA4]|uniref:helix-turn-helix domain-containing protein n=1 Tax=Kitasatospora sp. MAA4 TaxID=3035093 RepID=UPI0024739AE1|nr:helix-turn-helix transcriptional regulator [Kitasatospora sp. MAA4]MDH6133812.1 transcriptional regulator with XRE-family HTH domain [Kitasatospora sp. MAA4]